MCNDGCRNYNLVTMKLKLDKYKKQSKSNEAFLTMRSQVVEESSGSGLRVDWRRGGGNTHLHWWSAHRLYNTVDPGESWCWRLGSRFVMELILRKSIRWQRKWRGKVRSLDEKQNTRYSVDTSTNGLTMYLFDLAKSLVSEQRWCFSCRWLPQWIRGKPHPASPKHLWKHNKHRTTTKRATPTIQKWQPNQDWFTILSNPARDHFVIGSHQKKECTTTKRGSCSLVSPNSYKQTTYGAIVILRAVVG